jgi:cytidine deaminase
VTPRTANASGLPPANELVIGLVGAVGIDLKRVGQFLSVVLNDFEYRVHEIHLSELMRALTWAEPLPDGPFDERVAAFMDAGNKLRSNSCWARNDAFALLGLHRIALTRAETTGEIEQPADRQAYVLRSLKRPEEVDLLRQVYGSRFLLIACYAPKGAREAYLRREIRASRIKPVKARPLFPADELMRRDEREALPYGQDVRGTFHRADFFVDASDFDVKATDGDGVERPRFECEVRRIFEVFFGHPRRTPSRDEFGITQAAAAMRRSAELGRQVGAAICTPSGEVVAVGVNEVPKPGGGLYWEGDPGDRREFQLGRDTSDAHKREIAQQVAEGLAKAGLLGDGVDQTAVLEAVSRTDLDNLIEFIRAVHAEMAALIDAARRGIAVQGCTLFVTTFPCHHCARHIVAAGIRRVVYIAPYAKSLAEELHDDALVVTSNALLEQPAEAAGADPRVRFEPFVGVSPSRYMEMFAMPRRKDASGELAEWSPATAQPRLADLEPEELRTDWLPYLVRERNAQELLFDIVEQHKPGLSLEPPPRRRSRSRRGAGRRLRGSAGTSPAPTGSPGRGSPPTPGA